MKTQIRLPKARLLTACLLLFSFFFIHQSCTKINTDVPAKPALTDAEVTQKFFALPANAPVAVRRAADEMKKRNNQSEFLKNFVKNNGYPAWDKAIIPQQPQPVVNVSFNTGNIEEADTVVIIPVVPEGSTYAGSFIKATLGADVSLDFYRGSDYSVYSFNDVPEDSINADKAALQIMLLTRKVFGIKSFLVKDNRLFSSSNERNISLPDRIFTFIDTSQTGGNLSGIPLCNICVQWECIICHGADPNCPIGGHGSYCFSGPCDGDGSPFPGADPGGGTGTGGGGTGGSFPCAGSQGRTIGIADPCGPGTNLPPVNPIPPPKPPCEKITDLFNVPNIGYYYQNIMSQAGGEREMAYAFNSLGGGAPTTGKKNEVRIGMVDDCIGYIHCHDATSKYYLFSCKDIEQIYNNIIENRIDENATIGLITKDGTPYILTIQDIDAFKRFGQRFFDEEPNERKQETAYSSYFDRKITSAEKEVAFLKFMKDNDAGIALTRGNAFLNDFSELKLNSPGTLALEIPCN